MMMMMVNLRIIAPDVSVAPDDDERLLEAKTSTGVDSACAANHANTCQKVTARAHSRAKKSLHHLMQDYAHASCRKSCRGNSMHLCLLT